MEYYILHGEGQCDDKTESLKEAQEIVDLLLRDGCKFVYITDDNDNIVEDELSDRRRKVVKIV